MHLKDFSYPLPPNLIAYYPAKNRVDSRLLVLQNGNIQHAIFKDIVDLLQANDLLVLNDTRVMPARLFGVKTTGGKIEVLIERVLNAHEALAHVRASKSPKPGDRLLLESVLSVEMLGREEDLFRLRFHHKESIVDLLEHHGRVPLPPYIAREATTEDKARYQTVYANEQGSVAAPTAGLHFDESLLEKIKTKGVDIGYVTLHVGAGTFQPVRTEHIEDHQIHAETIEVSQALCDQIAQARKRGGRVIAVGTTTTRCLESAVTDEGMHPFSGETSIYIYPGYQFNCVDALITNFHLPESTLLMLVTAFGGYEQVMHAYHVAVEKQYRFYSYGDAMFIEKAQ